MGIERAAAGLEPDWRVLFVTTMSSGNAALPQGNLWAHLLPRPSSTIDHIEDSYPDSTLTPSMAPLDRTSTSVRILLHDTQTNIDKFSAKVEEMCNGMQCANHEIAEVKRLFQQERETTSDETYALSGSNYPITIRHPSRLLTGAYTQ